MTSRGRKMLDMVLQKATITDYVVNSNDGTLIPTECRIELTPSTTNTLQGPDTIVYSGDNNSIANQFPSQATYYDLDKAELEDHNLKNDGHNDNGTYDAPIVTVELEDAPNVTVELEDNISEGDTQNSHSEGDIISNTDESDAPERVVELKNNNLEGDIGLEDIGSDNGSSSDDETYTPNKAEGSETSSSEEHEVDRTVLVTKSRNKRRKTEDWANILNQKKREQGLPYQGKRKIGDDWDYKIHKPGKYLADPCKCIWSNKTAAVIKCRKLTEQQRLNILKSFWGNMKWPERKILIQTLVRCKTVDRRRGTEGNSRRNFTFFYFLKVGSETFRVCKKMFLGTLGLKETSVVTWVKQTISTEPPPTLSASKESEESQSRSEKRQSKLKERQLMRFEDKKASLKQFFGELPKMESHYCRASTKKLYLEPIWQSKTEIYRIYKTDFCQKNYLESSSIFIFNEIFEELNLSLYTPKKDLCDTCEAYKTKNITEEKYVIHQTLKGEARDEKNKDKFSDDTNLVYAMDLQSVLLSPKSTVSSMYYKTKLIVHNFTIYNLKTKEGYCFIWNEAEGGLTANEFSSIISYFIETEIVAKFGNDVPEIIIYSDGCTGQNRNATLASALLNLAMFHKITICQKYLLKGHTQMEVDSMHAKIEKQVRDRKINVPADYVHFCREARKNPFPYEVKYLTHGFFLNFADL